MAVPEAPRRTRLGRFVQRFTRPAEEIVADELRDNSERLGATPIADVIPRQPAMVCGEVRSVALRPRVQVPALVVELYDGTRPMNLVWLGRREIAGIQSGIMLRAWGRASLINGVPTIFNPSYEIVPQGG